VAKLFDMLQTISKYHSVYSYS